MWYNIFMLTQKNFTEGIIMTVEEKIDGVVQRVTKGVLKETYDTAIFDELVMLREHLDSRGSDYLEEIPTFAELSRTEMRKAQALVRKQLVQELSNEENSFLKTMRIVEALVALGYDVTKKTSNLKVKFCVKIWKANINEELETINLLDKI